ncbi:MAG: PilZ domain-containing protein [Terracidiphilus sp.]
MDKSYQALIRPPLGEGTPRTDDYVEARTLCAYNQTRGCILGVEVACGDFSFASLLERMPRLTPQSGTGLWLDPFKGIPINDIAVPLDLIYLDAQYRVLAVVELFPTYRVSPSIPPAASVLALPTHTIFTSGTLAGDKLGFGLAEEVEQELTRLRFSAIATAAQDKTAPLEEAQTSAAVALPVEEVVAVQPAEVAVPAQPWMKQPPKPRSWLQRLLLRGPAVPEEPRKAARAALPGLAAYFWDGGAPRAHEIRDISDTGLYVVTDERWYPGTLVQMTLKKSGGKEARAEATVCLMARASRWGNDGVGLSFVVRDARKPRGVENDGIERTELDRFLARIKHKS